MNRLMWLMYLLALLLASCASQSWKQDLGVRTARQNCASLPEDEHYTCVERHAVEALNPDICRLAGKWIDDMCLQALYEAADDATICGQVYLEGLRSTCRDYYAGRSSPMLAPAQAIVEISSQIMSGS